MAPEKDNRLSDGTIDPDTLRSASDRTASNLSSTSATSQLSSSIMSSRNASTSRGSSLLAFPLVAVTALSLSAALYTYAPTLSGFQLATVSRSLNEPWQIGALLAWRVTELGIAWGSGYDYWDVASLYILINAPYYFLLALFYEITFVPILLGLGIDLVSAILPFFIFRSLSAHNRVQYNPSSGNAQLAASFPIRAYTTIFGAATYAVVVYSSLYTWLPVYLVVNFDSIRTLEHAHGANLPIIFLACLPLGLAAKDYLFGPSIYYARTAIPALDFDPATATLSETIAWNVGLTGWGNREDVLAKRTTLLVLLTLANSIAKVFGTVDGAEIWGAIGWGSVFASAAAMAGLGFAWVGDV